MSSILFYSPFNQRSRDTESLMIAFHRQGHKVISLSQAEGYQIHDYLKLNGVETHSHVLKGKHNAWYYFRHLLYFTSFCRRHGVDIVYSHLEPANVVASLGQFFVRGKVYICRHHIDEASLYHFDRSLFYTMTYSLAKKIIVVSDRALRYMIDRERIEPKKIIHINLGYDFSLYRSADPAAILSIREKHKAQVLLLTVCRFTKYKRPEYSIAVLRKLIDLGIDAKLILLGSGEEEERLKNLMVANNMESRVSMPGYVPNVPDYLGAVDFLVHPSLLESSCVTVKEAALTCLPVIVCRGVGDFEDFIVDGENGFLADPENFIADATGIVAKHQANKEWLRGMGAKLRDSVIQRFDLKNIITLYDSLNQRP